MLHPLPGRPREVPWLLGTWSPRTDTLPPPRVPGAPGPRGTFLQVMTGKGSPAAAQGIRSSRPASCLYSQPGSTVKYGGSWREHSGREGGHSGHDGRPARRPLQSRALPSGRAAREQTGPWSPRCCKAHRCRCQGPLRWPPRCGWSRPPSGSNRDSGGGSRAGLRSGVRTSPGPNRARRGQGGSPSPPGGRPGRNSCPGAGCLGALPAADPHGKQIYACQSFRGGFLAGPRPAEAAP